MSLVGSRCSQLERLSEDVVEPPACFWVWPWLWQAVLFRHQDFQLEYDHIQSLREAAEEKAKLCSRDLQQSVEELTAVSYHPQNLPNHAKEVMLCLFSIEIPGALFQRRHLWHSFALQDPREWVEFEGISGNPQVFCSSFACLGVLCLPTLVLVWSVLVLLLLVHSQAKKTMKFGLRDCIWRPELARSKLEQGKKNSTPGWWQEGAFILLIVHSGQDGVGRAEGWQRGAEETTRVAGQRQWRPEGNAKETDSRKRCGADTERATNQRKARGMLTCLCWVKKKFTTKSDQDSSGYIAIVRSAIELPTKMFAMFAGKSMLNL